MKAPAAAIAIWLIVATGSGQASSNSIGLNGLDIRRETGRRISGPELGRLWGGQICLVPVENLTFRGEAFDRATAEWQLRNDAALDGGTFAIVADGLCTKLFDGMSECREVYELGNDRFLLRSIGGQRMSPVRVYARSRTCSGFYAPPPSKVRD